MPRYKLTIAYDGTDFCGWQKQEPFAPPHPGEGDAAHAPDQSGQKWSAAAPLPTREGEDRARVALRTVQHVVEQAVRAVVRENIILLGASRTDSGVHARGQVAAFTCGPYEAVPQSPDPQAAAVTDNTESDQPARMHVERSAGWPESRGLDRLVRAINGRLPPDVQVLACELAQPNFNPIGGATSKAYSYLLHISPPPPGGLALRPLWDRRYVQHVWDDLNVEAMNAAAQHFVGEHDFAAFAAAGHGRLTTVRTVHACTVTELPRVAEGRRVRIDISGNGFLWNMVRIITGTLVHVGKGRILPDAIPAIIASRDRTQAGPTFPPTGLCLEWIRYD